MASSNVLMNLDEFVVEDKFVIFEKQEHKMEQMSMDLYLGLMHARRRLLKEAGGEEDQYAQAAQAAELLYLVFPTIGKEKLRKLPIKAMIRLTDAVEKEMDFSTSEGGTGEGQSGE